MANCLHSTVAGRMCTTSSMLHLQVVLLERRERSSPAEDVLPLYELLLSPSEFSLSNQLFIHGQINFLHPRLCRTILVELRWHCTFLSILSRETLYGLRALSHGGTVFDWHCCLIKSPSSLLHIIRLRRFSIHMAFLLRHRHGFPVEMAS